MRCVVAFGIASFVIVLLHPPAGAAEPADTGGRPKQPNILLILTDQQHAGMLSCAGNRHVKTSAMDSLAATGTRFERAYCANPVCMPSRFSMMTGVMPSRINSENNLRIPDPLPPVVLANTLGRIFHEAGYETAYGGKVHLPFGFHKYGFRNHLSRDERDGLADACDTFLRQQHERPFLLVASFVNPHDICYMSLNDYARAQGGVNPWGAAVTEAATLAKAMQLPPGVSREEFFARICPPLPGNFEIPRGEPSATRQHQPPFPPRSYIQANWSEDQWRIHRWAYARLTERVDAEISRVLEALRQSGREEDTWVVFLSDHGDMDAAHRLDSKSVLYEEAVRVPLIVSRKGVTPAGRVDDQHLVSTGLDLLPTLCDLAAIPVPTPLKGRSVKPLAMGRQVENWREYLVVENERSRLLRSHRYKYIVYENGDPREMLIDLQEDPGEMVNLALDPTHRDVLTEHRAMLRQWYAAHDETLAPRYIVSPETGAP
jgi:choline-sulfatase